jgi:hypothetical protein
MTTVLPVDAAAAVAASVAAAALELPQPASIPRARIKASGFLRFLISIFPPFKKYTSSIGFVKNNFKVKLQQFTHYFTYLCNCK